ncbi:MAG: LOG family protein [Synechococcales cyanobacterium RM1_1_8]|nr:LOG family protein [Synechococcales cyanobacterium RM1_1_8]
MEWVEGFYGEMTHPCDPTPAPAYQLVQAAMFQMWDAVNQLSEIPPPPCENYRVTIFGSARLQATDPLYLDVRHLATELTHMGCDIVTGGGPGLMEAANQGSFDADTPRRTQSIGLRIDLDFEEHANPFVEQLHSHRTFFSRLHHFVLLSNAFVVVPGGIGTALEALMVWQLLQVKKLDQDMPLIMVGEMWRGLVDWASQSMLASTPQMASPGDMQIPRCVSTMEEAIVVLRTSKALWEHNCDC